MTQTKEDELREQEVATLKKIAQCLERIADSLPECLDQIRDSIDEQFNA